MAPGFPLAARRWVCVSLSLLAGFALTLTSCAGLQQLAGIQLRFPVVRAPQPSGQQIAAGAALGAASAPSVSRQPIGPSGGHSEDLVRELLSDYGTALGRCDVRALERLWVMRDIERYMVRSLCRRVVDLKVAIWERGLDLKTDRGNARFVQTLTYGDPDLRTPRSLYLTASLVRRSGGEWTIWRLRENE